MMNKPLTLLQSDSFIVLENYTPSVQSGRGMQSEKELEKSLINQLISLGYEYAPEITNHKAMLKNAKFQLERLNGVEFKDDEWGRFVAEFLLNPNENSLAKSKKINDDPRVQFRFNNGTEKNISLVDRRSLNKNKLQVIHQYSTESNHKVAHHRYDVTLLVNGLPLVHIELKKRGEKIREAFNQVHRYSKGSFNDGSSLYGYVQMFVISNGTSTRYFANTIDRGDISGYGFTIEWARRDNERIQDLTDFTKTFFEKRVLLEVLLKYSVFTHSNQLLMLRPYQIAAAERIIERVKYINNHKMWGGGANKSKAGAGCGGFVWHATGSGKTLTSFKTAQLVTEMDCVDKVFFVVDRKDLDNQTLQEYKKFSESSVLGTSDTKELEHLCESNESNRKIVVTTIQKLNRLVSARDGLSVYSKRVVFIFDECHRSQFGQAQSNIKKRFKSYCQFGFTGTPIFEENAPIGGETTEGVFGSMLHTYVLTDAIRDEKVLKFKISHHNVVHAPIVSQPEPGSGGNSQNKNKINGELLAPNRILKITNHILERAIRPENARYNALFAVDSIEAAIKYYDCFKATQEASDNQSIKSLKIATIYSAPPNGEMALDDKTGLIADEGISVDGLGESARQSLAASIEDYNKEFSCSFSVGGSGFSNYYADVSNRVKQKKIDILIVVGMFLTGFDSKRINTLYVDKALKYHGLIQAFSRTNRIYNDDKAYGNIITFRDLDNDIQNAIKLFSNAAGSNIEKDSGILFEVGFEKMLLGHGDGKERVEGYKDVLENFQKQFGVYDIQDLRGLSNRVKNSETDEREFIDSYGKLLRIENKLRLFEEFEIIKNCQSGVLSVVGSDIAASLNVSEYVLSQIKSMSPLPDDVKADCKSIYKDIMDKVISNRASGAQTKIWDGVTFEVELVQTQIIDLDYILSLINNIQKSKVSDEDKSNFLIRVQNDPINKERHGLLAEYADHSILNKIEASIEGLEKFKDDKAKEEISQASILMKARDKALAQNILEKAIERGRSGEIDVGSGIDAFLPKGLPNISKESSVKKKEIKSWFKMCVEKFKSFSF